MSEDLTGKRFGRLIVINISKKYNYWLCKCDCGKEKIIRKDALITGVTKSCGCLQKETISKIRQQNLVNKVFTHLTVIEKVDKPLGKEESIYWLCKCSCGGEIIANTKDLNANRVKSCGCVHGINMINLIFGRLKVIKKHSIKDEKYLCECSCGNSTVVDGIKLRNGHTKSCGCLKKEIASVINKKYNQFDLSLDYGVGYTSLGEIFYFDLEDFDLIKDYCWYITKAGYLSAHIDDAEILLHRLVMFAKTGDEIDHKNRNPIDCQKDNLRFCTHCENMKNQSLSKNNKSGITGVFFDQKHNKWKSALQNNGISYKLGTFINKVDAIKARLDAEFKYFKEFAPQKHLFKEFGIGEENYD